MQHIGEITIRSATASDDWAVERLFAELHMQNAALDARFALAEGWQPVLVEHLTHTRLQGNGLTMLAWADTTPVGLLMMGIHNDSRLFRHRSWAEVLALYIAPQLRGVELGTRLLGVGTAWAREQGYDRVQLYVTATNEQAKQFYARAGFRSTQEIWRLELGEVPTRLERALSEALPGDPNPLSAHTHYILLEEDEV